MHLLELPDELILHIVLYLQPHPGRFDFLSRREARHNLLRLGYTCRHLWRVVEKEICRELRTGELVALCGAYGLLTNSDDAEDAYSEDERDALATKFLGRISNTHVLSLNDSLPYPEPDSEERGTPWMQLVLCVALAPPQQSEVFSGLQSLHVQVQTTESLRLLTSFIHRPIMELDLEVSHPDGSDNKDLVRELLEAIHPSPVLQTLRLVVRDNNPLSLFFRNKPPRWSLSLRRALAILLTQHTNISTLMIDTPGDNRGLLPIIAKYSSLRSLRLQGAPTTDIISLVIPYGELTVLRNLKLNLTIDLIPLLEKIPTPFLESFSTLTRAIEPEQLRAVCAVLAGKWSSTLSSFEVTIISHDNPRANPPVIVPDDDTAPDAILPLLSCRNIRVLKVSRSKRLPFGDSQVAKMAAAWPKLEELEFDEGYCIQGTPLILSTASFIQIIEACPSLRNLQLSIDFDRFGPRTLLDSQNTPESQISLQFLDLSGSTCNSPVLLSSFILRTLPSVSIFSPGPDEGMKQAYGTFMSERFPEEWAKEQAHSEQLRKQMDEARQAFPLEGIRIRWPPVQLQDEGEDEDEDENE